MNDERTIKGTTSFHFVKATEGGGLHGVSFCVEPASVAFHKNDVRGDDVQQKLTAMEADDEFQGECVLAIRAALLPILRKRMNF